MTDPATDLRLRAAVLADVPDIVRLLSEDAIGPRRESHDEAGSPAYDQAFAAIDADPNNELVVATVADRVVGCMQLTTIRYLTHYGGVRLQVEGVRVDRELRSRGIGEAMLRYAIERATASGCHLVQLTTNAQRTDAHRFYRRLGFEPTHVGFKLHLPEAPGGQGEKSTDGEL
jgi:ribosomal protein S18 acetylase RimI-like enzyme